MDVTPTAADFARVYESGKPQIVYTRLVNDLDTPVSAFLKIARHEPHAFLFESVLGGEQRGRYSLLGLKPDLIWKCEGGKASFAFGKDAISSGLFEPALDAPLDSLRGLLANSAFDIPDDLPPMAAGLFGYLGYDMVRHIEHLPDVNADPIKTPDAMMIRPTIIAIFDQIAQEIILSTPVFPGDIKVGEAYANALLRLRNFARDLSKPIAATVNQDAELADVNPRSSISRNDFKARVETVKDYIEAGDAFQVVIGQRFEAKLPESPFALYRSLRRMNPSPFLYFLNFDDHAIVGSSPEILVRLRDNQVTIRPIAGTRPRGATVAEDIAHEKDLLTDEKECAEHLMLLDLGRNDVGRVAKTGTVTVTEKFIIERYSHVMHIVSNVVGEIKDDYDALSALFAGFPAGTVSGAPKVRAMEIIDELENEKRGIYGGAVGYISCAGDMDTAIALRTGIVKDGILHVRAGAGIVADSDPDAEYEETIHKSAALFRAAEKSSVFSES